MAQYTEPLTGEYEFEDPNNLSLDLTNPRAPSENFTNEDEVMNYLIDYADINELIQSILTSGWRDYEPLIVLRDENKNIVLEGNRRLAALRILRDVDLRKRLQIDLDEEPGPEALPNSVRIQRVSSRSQARAFIGFKHINGPYKWDSLAKAQYAAEWLQEGADIKEVSRCLGDGHNTVVRLVNGWHVFSQSLSNGFDLKQRTRNKFYFSHLYTGLARPNVRHFLGLSADDPSTVLGANPVADENLGHLNRFMSWLYGQRNEPAVIQRQNPDLNHLVNVLGNDTARAMLEATRALDRAYDQIEDKDLRLRQTLMRAIKEAEDALRFVPHYSGRADLLIAGNNLLRTVQTLHGVIKDRAKAGNDTDADL